MSLSFLFVLFYKSSERQTQQLQPRFRKASNHRRRRPEIFPKPPETASKYFFYFPLTDVKGLCNTQESQDKESELMKTYTIPNTEKSTDTTTAITETEAKWIRQNMPPIELELVGWIDRLYPADVMAAVTQDLREVSGVTQATRVRLRQGQFISSDADPVKFELSLQRWRLIPAFQEHLAQTRSNVLGEDKLITITLARTGTTWKIAPLYFNQFCKTLIELAPTKQKKVKLAPLKPSPLWSFTPA
jgi:hypothetical protein